MRCGNCCNYGTEIAPIRRESRRPKEASADSTSHESFQTDNAVHTKSGRSFGSLSALVVDVRFFDAWGRLDA